ncbi:MAG: glycine--tRNA ligase subunit beta [Thermodesulfobacteriota bacterium]
MEQLLIEIGTEEIPSGYIEPALHAFRSMLTQRLQKERIECGEAFIYGTPRRLAVVVDDVAPRQVPVDTEIIGPPERVAYDEAGRLTVAAKKFAEKAGVGVSRLEIKETAKGRYLCIHRTEKGQNTPQILRRVLPELIVSIPFPKTMRWKDLRIAFARPIHSIAALYGDRVVSFTVGDVKSSRNTFGHRFLSPGKIRLAHPAEYLEKLQSAFVIADVAKRKARMENSIHKAVAGTGGILLNDEALLEMVCNLVEYPEVVLGSFDRKFLALPPEILVTAMRSHQRYFAVMDNDDNMMPHFVAVSNNRARNMGVVVSGYERVLDARLEDARFFYNADLAISLEDMVEKLKSVVFQAQLGSVNDKTQRVRKLCGFIADNLNFKNAEKENLDLAALYCKADLVSHVVIEFPNLQGIIGRVYAKKAGHSDRVAAAIEEHYRPTSSGGKLPETKEGAALGIADKMDTLCGCFLVGLVPTGASDPYALRRQAIGLIATVRENGFDISLSEVIRYGMHLFDGYDEEAMKDAADNLYDFLKNRMAHMLEEESIPKDMAAAILAVSSDNIPDVWSRARAFFKMKSQPGFLSLAIAFKRVVNIIRKADPTEVGSGEVREALFENEAEASLFKVFGQTEANVADCLKNQDAEAAFRAIAGIKDPVDRFFDDVMVMTDNEKLRRNRLALLKRISDLFARLADFSRIST